MRRALAVIERNEATSLMDKDKDKALVQSNENLAHLSTTDPLTGLANRHIHMFDQYLHAEWQSLSGHKFRMRIHPAP